jgi:poly(3-hydroxybutyrate) depolymerase
MMGRWSALRFGSLLMLTTALACPQASDAAHDDVPAPSGPSTARGLQAVPNLDRRSVTVSGLSSGGFFAHQFHIAYSKLVNGAGIVAGGPYGCVENIPNPWSVL